MITGSGYCIARSCNMILDCQQRVAKLEKRVADLNPTHDTAASDYWRVKIALAKANYDLGMAYEAERQYKNAVAAFYSAFICVPETRYFHTILCPAVRTRTISGSIRPSALTLLKKDGNPETAFQLGLQFLSGIGEVQDDFKAYELISFAAEQGHIEAQFMKGWMLEDGRSVKSDAVAFKFYSLAANQGHADAQVMLGNMYLVGRGVPQNHAKGLRLIRQSLSLGCVTAYFVLAEIYFKGEVITKDYAQAIELFRMSIDLGFNQAEAIRHLNSLYKECHGPATPPDAILYRQDLRRGIKYAKFMLKKCVQKNPDDFDCQYHLMLVRFNHDQSAVKLNELFRSYPEKIVSAVIHDEFLTELQRFKVQETLYELTHTWPSLSSDITSSLAFYVGSFYYEQLPQFSTDLEEQALKARQAANHFQVVNDTSKHYEEAAAALLNIKIRFDNLGQTEADALFHELFTAKNKQHPVGAALQKMDHARYLHANELLLNYTQSINSKSGFFDRRSRRAHQDRVKQLLTHRPSPNELVDFLTNLMIDENDELVMIRHEIVQLLSQAPILERHTSAVVSTDVDNTQDANDDDRGCKSNPKKRKYEESAIEATTNIIKR
jgi:TPR repeat protein